MGEQLSNVSRIGKDLDAKVLLGIFARAPALSANLDVTGVLQYIESGASCSLSKRVRKICRLFPAALAPTAGAAALWSPVMKPSPRGRVRVSERRRRIVRHTLPATGRALAPELIRSILHHNHQGAEAA